jgi:putative membrane protein
MYLYIKALHIIFIITWFAGMFYMPRLFIYNTEAAEKSQPEKDILQKQFGIMMTTVMVWHYLALCFLTLIFGPWVWYLLDSFPQWLMIKLCFVVGLYVYHLTLHIIYRQQMREYSSIRRNS